MFECCVLPSNTAALFFRDNRFHAEDGRISYTNNISGRFDSYRKGSANSCEIKCFSLSFTSNRSNYQQGIHPFRYRTSSWNRDYAGRASYWRRGAGRRRVNCNKWTSRRIRTICRTRDVAGARAKMEWGLWKMEGSLVHSCLFLRYRFPRHWILCWLLRHLEHLRRLKRKIP